MLSKTLRNPVLSLTAFAAIMPLAMGCGTHEIDSGNATIHVATEDGRSQSLTVAIGEVLADAPFESLDILVASPGDIFEFPAVTLERTEDGLRVIEQVGALKIPAEVTWSEDLTTLTVAGAVETTITLNGSSARRAELVAYVAADALGASLSDSDLADGTVRHAAMVLLALAALGVFGYVACMTVGSDQCLQAALATCSNGIDAYKVVCGAGTDVNGTFQLGYLCSYRCN